MNLFKALSYKEWVKTRRTLGVLTLLSVAVLAYTFIEVTHSIRLDEAINVWYEYLFLNGKLTAAMLILPVIAGLALALVQFIPEMINKRLKLTMHLPYGESSIIAAMLLYGYLTLGVLFSFITLMLVLGMRFLLPLEIIDIFISQLTPALVAGLSVYGFTAWICFEPQWKQRILNLIIAIGLLSVLFISNNFGVYSKFEIGLLITLITSFAFPFYSALRFKHGVQ